MRGNLRLGFAVIAAAVVLTACSRKIVVANPPPERSTAVTLGIPPGHLPPPGQCRIWVAGRPPGQQRRADACSTLERQVPPGAWLVYRPDRDKKRVKVTVYDDRSPKVIVIRYFDAGSGKLLREEKP